MNVKFLVTSLLFSCLSFSQNFTVGPEIGMNLIKLDKEQIGNNYQPSWHTGLAAEYNFTDWLSIKSGLFYTQKRQAFSSKDTSLFPLIALIIEGGIDGIDLNTYSETEGRYTLNFIQIPLMASFNYNGLSLFTGGYIGYQFSVRSRELEISNTPFVSIIDIASFDTSGNIASFLQGSGRARSRSA